MKVFIQDRSKLLFLTPLGDWSADRTEAQDFRTTLAAIDYCSVANLEGAHMLLQLDDPCWVHLVALDDLSIAAFTPGLRKATHG
jgi:hypothetical protein